MDGFEGRLLLDLRTSPAWDDSLPVLTELNCSEDLSITGPQYSMIASKGRKNRQVKVYFHGTQADCVITASIVMEPADAAAELDGDPAYIAVVAALRNKTPVVLYIADRAPQAGDNVDRGQFNVFMPEKAMQGNDEAALTVQFAPAKGAAHPLEVFTWPSS